MSSTAEVKKFEYIDVMRGLAILGVIAVHCQQELTGLPPLVVALFQFGQMGVVLFFVASAMTLCLSTASRHESQTWKFYARRFFRIAPLFYFGIALYLLWRLLLQYQATHSLSLPANYNLAAFVETVLFINGFSPKNFHNLVPGGWSIATEMMFYAVFPLLFRLQMRIGHLKFVYFSLATTLACLAIEYVFLWHVQPLLLAHGIAKHRISNDAFGFLYANIVNQLPVFLIGMITYSMLQKTLSVRSGLLAAALLSLSCLLMNAEGFRTGMNGAIYPILAAIGFALLAVRLAHRPSITGLPWRLLIQIGQYSYSIYLMHFIIVDIEVLGLKQLLPPQILNSAIGLTVLLAGVVAGSLGAARLTYRYIERPGIEWGRRLIG
jgi:peptidoglycan/LPS O-acetylase OafA/YrhL